MVHRDVKPANAFHATARRWFVRHADTIPAPAPPAPPANDNDALTPIERELARTGATVRQLRALGLTREEALRFMRAARAGGTP